MLIWQTLLSSTETDDKHLTNYQRSSVVIGYILYSTDVQGDVVTEINKTNNQSRHAALLIDKYFIGK